jgi:hypothetical protein
LYQSRRFSSEWELRQMLIAIQHLVIAASQQKSVSPVTLDDVRTARGHARMRTLTTLLTATITISDLKLTCLPTA